MDYEKLFSEQPLATMHIIMLHTTATPLGMEVTVDDIRRWHRARGFSDVGYNFIVSTDGSVHKGRPLDRAGAHAVGYNRTAVGIAYVGGLDDEGRPSDTRTPQQKQAMLALIAALRRRFPQLTRLMGHNQVAAKACPCFRVDEEEAFRTIEGLRDL